AACPFLRSVCESRTKLVKRRSSGGAQTLCPKRHSYPVTYRRYNATIRRPVFPVCANEIAVEACSLERKTTDVRCACRTARAALVVDTRCRPLCRRAQLRTGGAFTCSGGVRGNPVG